VSALLLTGGFISAAAGGLAIRRARHAAPVSRVSAMLGFALASVLAGVLAWVKVFRRQRSPMWEPTRRLA
jgi:uncharacterized membrane protein